MTDHSEYMNQSIQMKRQAQPRKPARRGWVRALVLGLAWALALAVQSSAQELSNDSLTLRLGISPEGIPIIKEAVWLDSGKVAFRDMGTPNGLDDWAPAALLPPASAVPTDWEVSEGESMTTAEATRELANKMSLTWIVELPKHGELFRLHMRLTNGGKKARAVEWFPGWAASWNVGGQSQWARWWESLKFDRTEQALSNSRTIRLGSRLHSSDDAGDGVNPYWVVGGEMNRIYFGLQWSGGWSATLRGLDNGFTYSVGLPPAETQLVLNRRETIEGPALLVMPVADADEAESRGLWMRHRYNLGRTLYGGPRASFPLIYNSWYAIRQMLNADFLSRQVATMTPYAFDAFVLDAGWFMEGRWKPDPDKFPGGEMTDTLAALKANGIKPGLWSTPQYVSDNNNAFALTLEDPPLENRFLSGYLLDLSQAGFSEYLENHVQGLRSKYSVDYWKYDQPFFTEVSRSGEMKNVVGFQSALQNVRLTNPDLTIENCLNGGRMINDFTLLATQTSWLNDYGRSGFPDPQVNIRSALNALESVFPWAALRFTIRMDTLDPDDDEMARLCCRSAMIGMWGLSTDLSQIGERQQKVILQEVANYRRLNPLKFSCVYDLRLPSDDAEAVGVTFYSSKRYRAGVLLYRWEREGAFDEHVTLARLKPELTYHVVDVDTGAEFTASGSDLIRNGVNVSFGSQRLSAMLFIETVTPTATAK